MRIAVQDGLNVNEVQRQLSQFYSQYKPQLQTDPAYTRPRHVFRISRVYRKDGIVVDLGGGISVHNGVLAEMGMKVFVVDLLGDYWERKASEPTSIDREVKVLETSGVQFIRQDVSACDLTDYFAENSVDAVTSFHCVEHLHQSPKKVLESAMRVLKPGGTLLIEVPNAANARKRVALLFGRTNYLPYNLLYYSADYRGHIREYVTDDLRQLAHNLGAKSYQIFGNNTYGGRWIDVIPAPLRRAVDVALKVFPGLCGALLLEASKS
jgi:ubiquinone/menaquinone biosynthesis C-methylase UbiE